MYKRQDITARIAEANTTANTRDSTLIGVLARARAETLALTIAILEARLAGDEAGVVTKITFPIVAPDPDRAKDIEAEMAALEEVIAKAEVEVSLSKGLIQAVAVSRVQAEKLTLARLRGALMQARYGAMLPVEVDTTTTVRPPVAAKKNPDDLDKDIVANSTQERPSWADPDYPKINYDHSIFQNLDTQGFEIHGWWGVKLSRAAIDDSPSVFGLQVEHDAKARGFDPDTPGIQIGCREGTISFVYDTDDFIVGDFRRDGLNVTYRIDDKTAVTRRWSELTSKSGAGVFGQAAMPLLKELYNAESVFFRIVERDGQRHDATFNLNGIQVVIDAAAQACGVSMLDLSREDYRAIQEMLNAGGFDAGIPDGIWGKGSKTAMRAYQEANGLPVTGAPDRMTLRKMGLPF